MTVIITGANINKDTISNIKKAGLDIQVHQGASMTGTDKRIKKRLVFVFAIFIVLILALLVQIFWIQLIDGAWYKSMVYAQDNKSRIISAKRGNIYDRNNNELAVNIPVNTISVNPLAIGKSKISVEKIAQKMSEILQLDREDILKKLHKPDQYEVIKRKVESGVSDKLRQWMSEDKINGIYFEEDTKRYYPGNTLASHVVGFTGTDNQGLTGVEYSMEQYLEGVSGKEAVGVDSKGLQLPFSEGSHIDVKDGLNVVLTIDEAIQEAAEKELQTAIDEYKVLGGGTVIVMDPKNGDILAMVSKPDFNLNDPFAVPADMPGEDSKKLSGLKSDDRIRELQKEVWTNKAVNSTYEPGSTFKLITAAASLEESIIAPESEVVDKPVKVAGWTINSTVPGGRGNETFSESVYNSDNPVFVKLARILGMDKFYSYVRAFGFYDRTGIELPGEAGSIIQENPREIDMATAAFGQSFQITPIQLITAYTAIENGGDLMKPRIIKELTDSNNIAVKIFNPEVIRNVISKKTSETLRNLLEGAVQQGTGVEANIGGYRIAGKTGTSETIENGVRSKDRFIASFMGFAPANDPAISVLVVLDHPSVESHLGGKVAAPVAAKIMQYALNYFSAEQRH